MTRLRSATRDTFRSLRIRNFRLFFSGQAISQSGTWMQAAALSWLVLRITNSGTALGAVNAAAFLPVLLFGAWGGVLADRFDKHRLLLVTQTLALVQATTLATLVLTNHVNVPILYALAAVLGFVNAADNPARRAFVTEMVGVEDATNAVSLNSAMMTGSKVIGPATAGILITTVGLGWCFAVNAISYVAVLVGLLAMRRRELHPSRRVVREKGQVRDGLRYVWANPSLRTAMIVMTVVGTLAFNFQVVMPLFAKRTLGGGALTYTLLSSITSLGAVVGALTIARRRVITNRFLSKAAMLLGGSMAVFALAPNLLAAIIIGPVLGASSLAFLSGSGALLQLESSPSMRGRVLALSAVVFLGSTPIGGPIIGWVSQQWSPRYGLGVGAVAALLAGGWGLWSVRQADGLAILSEGDGQEATARSIAAVGDPNTVAA